MDFAGAVRGHDHDRRLRRFHRAHFRNGDLKIGEHFEQESFEGFVGAIDFIDKEHRRAGGIGLERLQQRPLDQEALREDVVLEPRAVLVALGLGDADGDHLRGIIPFIDRGCDVEALVALQPDEAASERRGQDLGDLGLADFRLAFEKNRSAHFQRQKQHRAKRTVGQIFGLGEEIDGGVNGNG